MILPVKSSTLHLDSKFLKRRKGNDSEEKGSHQINLPNDVGKIFIKVDVLVSIAEVCLEGDELHQRPVSRPLSHS